MCVNYEKQIDIAVIIPIYNGEKYLSEAIESVLAQPCENIDLVLVDDGSRDSTPALCDQWAANNERIHVIHKPNGGVSSARNAGIDYVLNQLPIHENTYIAFLDADDVWCLSAIDQTTADLMGMNYDLICFQTCVCNHDFSRCQPIVQLHGGNHIGGNPSVWIHRGHFAAILYRAEFLKNTNLKFYLIRASEDKIFLMQALYLADHIHQENRKLYQYRQNLSSVMHTREMGIPYFEPIIDSYIKSDKDMSVWANDVRGILTQGRVLARIYIMDMIDEHFQIRKSKKEIEEFIRSKPEYIDILYGPFGESDLTERLKYMRKHPFATIVKNGFYGIIMGIARKIYYFGPIKTIADRWRYPIKI